MAQTQIYTKQSQVVVIEESAQDTYETLVAGSAILAEISDEPMTISSEQAESQYVRGDGLQMDDPPPGSISASIDFAVPLRGGGKPSTDVLAPDYGEALKACGMQEISTGSPVTSINYVPHTVFDGAGGNPGPSYTVGIIEAGHIAWAIKGAFGTWTLDGAVGQQARLAFTFTGEFVDPVDHALLVPTYDTLIAPAFQNATFTIAAVAPIGVSSLQVDLGNSIVTVVDVNETNGILGSRIVTGGRRTTGTFDPQLEQDLGPNPWALWKTGTVFALATGVIGSTAGNRWQFKANRCSRRQPDLASADGIRKYSQAFKAGSAATDVEGTNFDVELEFT